MSNSNSEVGECNAGDSNTGNINSGYSNSGDSNSGNRNTGNRNSGYSNSGSRNTGYRNTGSCNAGDHNTGDRNVGHRNAGYNNTGYNNTGNINSGDCNSGSWNTGSNNTGYLNTDNPRIRIFNKETDAKHEELTFPNYFYLNLTEWVQVEDMTEKEKEENEQYKVTGGFLKVYNYKEAWRKSWNKASLEDRKKTLQLPNWDNAIFLEISGIDVEKELSQPQLDDDTEEAIKLLKSKGFIIVKGEVKNEGN